MNAQTQNRWATVLVLIVVVLIAAAAMWYQLAREGRLPTPEPWMRYLATGVLILGVLIVVWLRRVFVRETEDAAALRQWAAESRRLDAASRDFTREYPLVFRPEWRGVVLNAGMTAMTLMLAVLQAQRLSTTARAAAFAALAAFIAGLVMLLMSRRLVVSWPGVTLREIRRERFWSWDQIEAVVLWDRRGKRRPALRLRTLQGEGELVNLGGIDFANEDLLFEVLLNRVRTLEFQVDDKRMNLTPHTDRELQTMLEALREEDGVPWLGAMLPEDDGEADGTGERAPRPAAQQTARPPLGDWPRRGVLR